MSRTPAAPARRWTARRVALLLAALAAALLVSLAGKHALERRLGDGVAILVSHVVGLLVAGGVLRRGGFRRPRAAPPDATAG
jgi:hypothetical protein